MICPLCGNLTKQYDYVLRIVRHAGNTITQIKVPRMRCVSCRGIRRKLPDILYPYKQYDAEIIKGVVEGLITSDTLGYEDYPCEMTMKRWKAQNLHILL